MVIQSSEEAKNPSSPAANPQAGTANPESAAYGYDFPFRGMRQGRGGMRGGWGMYMGRGRPHAHPAAQRPEVVSLEGEAAPSDPFHSHPHPAQRAFWGTPAAPDPPLAPTPPVAPDAPAPPQPPSFGFGGPHQPDFATGLASWIGDVASHFGAPAPPGAPNAPRSGPFGHGGPMGGGPMGWRMRGRGGWRGGWGRPTPPHAHEHHHGHHHHHRHPGFPGHEHGPIRPKMNIQHAGNIFTVTVELPGLQKEDVDISVADGVLTISGEFVDNAPGDDSLLPGYESEGDGFEMMDEDAYETHLSGAEPEVAESDTATNVEGTHPQNQAAGDRGGFVLRERRFGPFKRSVKLPSWVDVDTIKATMAHGVLSLVVEKPQAPETSGPPKKIQVL